MTKWPAIFRRRSLTLSQKLAVALAALLLGLLVMGGLTYRTLLASSETVALVEQSTVPAVAASYEIRINVSEFSAKVLSYLSAPGAELRASALKNHDDIGLQQQRYVQAVRTAQERELGEKAGRLLASYRLQGQRVMYAADRLQLEVDGVVVIVRQIGSLIDAEMLAVMDASSPRARQKYDAARGIELKTIDIAQAIRFYAQDASAAHRTLVLNTAESLDHELMRIQLLPLLAREKAVVEKATVIWKAVRPQLIDAVALKDEADQLHRDFNGQRVVLERLFDEGGMRAGAAQRLAAALQTLQAHQARLQFAMVLGAAAGAGRRSGGLPMDQPHGAPRRVQLELRRADDCLRPARCAVARIGRPGF